MKTSLFVDDNSGWDNNTHDFSRHERSSATVFNVEAQGVEAAFDEHTPSNEHRGVSRGKRQRTEEQASLSKPPSKRRRTIFDVDSDEEDMIIAEELPKVKKAIAYKDNSKAKTESRANTAKEYRDASVSGQGHNTPAARQSSAAMRTEEFGNDAESVARLLATLKKPVMRMSSYRCLSMIQATATAMPKTKTYIAQLSQSHTRRWTKLLRSWPRHTTTISAKSKKLTLKAQSHSPSIRFPLMYTK